MEIHTSYMFMNGNTRNFSNTYAAQTLRLTCTCRNIISSFVSFILHMYIQSWQRKLQLHIIVFLSLIIHARQNSASLKVACVCMD